MHFFLIYSAGGPLPQPTRQPIQHNRSAHHQIRQTPRGIRSPSAGMPNRDFEGLLDPHVVT